MFYVNYPYTKQNIQKNAAMYDRGLPVINLYPQPLHISMRKSTCFLVHYTLSVKNTLKSATKAIKIMLL